MTHPSSFGKRLAHHQTFFYRQPDTGHVKAVCTCGWHEEHDSTLEARTAAAVHDLEEE